MIFEVQGKTDNYVRLEKDGKGIKFLGKQVKLQTICKSNQLKNTLNAVSI